MRKYKHVFFDLDRTLWDFDTNSLETIKDLYNIYNIKTILNCDFLSFHATYIKYNTQLWDAYRKAEIKKEFFPKGFFDELSELSVGITSVIKEKSGSLSYWALNHSDTRPNFHHFDSFKYKF